MREGRLKSLIRMVNSFPHSTEGRYLKSPLPVREGYLFDRRNSVTIAGRIIALRLRSFLGCVTRLRHTLAPPIRRSDHTTRFPPLLPFVCGRRTQKNPLPREGKGWGLLGCDQLLDQSYLVGGGQIHAVDTREDGRDVLRGFGACRADRCDSGGRGDLHRFERRDSHDHSRQ